LGRKQVLEVVAGDTPCAACSIVARRPPKNKKNRFGKESFWHIMYIGKKNFRQDYILVFLGQKRLGNNVLAKKGVSNNSYWQNCFGQNGREPIFPFPVFAPAHRFNPDG